MYTSSLHCYSRIDPRFSPNILGELRRKATHAIVAFYDNETNLVSADQPKELDLSECHLKSLPNLFSWPPFTGLVKLDLSSNRLETLPFIHKLQNLQYLDLKGNHLEYLPNTLFACRNTDNCTCSLLEASNNQKERASVFSFSRMFFQILYF